MSGTCRFRQNNTRGKDRSNSAKSDSVGAAYRSRKADAAWIQSVQEIQPISKQISITGSHAVTRPWTISIIQWPVLQLWRDRPYDSPL